MIKFKYIISGYTIEGYNFDEYKLIEKEVKTEGYGIIKFKNKPSPSWKKILKDYIIQNYVVGTNKTNIFVKLKILELLDYNSTIENTVDIVCEL